MAITFDEFADGWLAGHLGWDQARADLRELIDSENAQLLSTLTTTQAEVARLKEALKNLCDDCLIVAEGLNDYPPCTQTAIPRNDASKKLRQYAADARAVLGGVE